MTEDPTRWSVDTEVKSITIVSLRDQFAMAALTGLISNANTRSGMEQVTKKSYEFADKMMEARKNDNS